MWWDKKRITGKFYDKFINLNQLLRFKSLPVFVLNFVIASFGFVFAMLRVFTDMFDL